MAAALALAGRGRGLSTPNPNVGCVIVRDGRLVGRGWTQPGGRPHAEAMALAVAGDRARGATAYVTLEPCAEPGRGPPCAGELIRAGVARVVAAIGDPFPAVNGAGFRTLEIAGVAVAIGCGAEGAERVTAGFLMRQRHGRPHVTLKLATSLDGGIALADGRSRWITGETARAHAHLERARADAILVGRGTYDADAPMLDVRLAGLEGRSPRRLILSTVIPAQAGIQIDSADWTPASAGVTAGWDIISSPAAIADLENVDHLLVEGGAGAAAAFLRADLVDRLLLYRAPILIGDGRAAIADLGLGDLAEAHGRWRLADARALGSDRLEVYERARS